MRVSVIVPQYGRWQLTAGCLSSLRRWHRFPFEVIVVDDGGPAEDWRALESLLSDDVRRIRQRHQGVTAAWNFGWREATGEVLVFLNNDAFTLQPWLDEVTEVLSRDPRTLIGAGWQEMAAQRSVPAECFPEKQRSPLLTGWLLACRREAGEQVGLFDPAMGLYWSDTDWQLRWLHRFADASPLTCLPEGKLRHTAHATTRHQQDRRSLWLQDREAFRNTWQERIARQEATC